jgi:hypothetical protein
MAPRVLVVLTATVLMAAAACGQPRAKVTILNDLGGYDIMEIYVYPDSVRLRGANLITGPLLPGEAFDTKVLPGIYNVVAIDEDGDSYHYGSILVGRNGYQVRVSLDEMNMGVIHTGGGPVPVEIRNSLPGLSIYYAYASMTAGSYGGSDILRTTVMLSGETLVYWTVPGTWSFMLEDENGDQYTIENVTVGDSGYVWDVTGADRAGGF